MPDHFMLTLRRWYWRYIRRHDGETCDACGRAFWFGLGETYWLAPSGLWLSVIGKRSGKRCPACFTREARNRGIGIRWEAVETPKDFVPKEAD